MAKFRLSAGAGRDLREIGARSVAEYGEAHAVRFMSGFDRVFDLLRARPRAGPRREEFDGEIRTLSYRPYTIFYEIEDETIVVLRVIHQARDIRIALGTRH